MNDRILIVGAGAVGGLLGAKLLSAGRDVTFLVRPARAEALRRDGLTLVDAEGSHRFEPGVVIAAELDTTYDVVVLAVKATVLEAAIADLRRAVGPATLVVPLLNGLGHFDRLDADLGARAVLGGLTTMVATLTPEGDIHQLMPGVTLRVGVRAAACGEHDAARATLEVAARAALATLAVDGVDTTYSTTVDSDLWHKWAFVAGIGAATTLLGGSAGDIARTPDGTAIAERVIEETCAVSSAAGFPIDPASMMAPFADPASELTSSLYRDVRAGRLTEVDAVLGDLVARASALGVDVPLVRATAARVRVTSP